MAILGGGYLALGACVAALSTRQWLWLSVPVVLLVLAALGYLVASWIKSRARKLLAGTVYGVTTRRALIVNTYPALAVKALQIDAITDVISVDQRGDFADLCLRSSASADFVFRGLPEPEKARAQLMRVIRDPQGVEQEIAASEAYSLAMHRLASR